MERVAVKHARWFTSGNTGQFTALWLQCLLMLCLAIPGFARAGNELTIYTEDWPPVTFKNGDKPDGMAVEVVQELQRRIGNTSAIQVVPWNRAYKALLDEANVMIFTVGWSEERERQMTLIGPVAVSRTVLYTRKGNAARLQALKDDIKHLAVGAYRGSIFADAATRKGFQTLELAGTPQVVAKMLMSGRFDLWSEGSVVVSSVLKEIGYTASDVEPVMVLESLDLYLAFSAKTPLALIRQWEDALRQMKKDGSFQKIHQKWFPNEPVPAEVTRKGLTAQ